MGAVLRSCGILVGLGLVLVLGAVAVSPVARAANAQDVSLQLRQGSAGVEAVLRWTGIPDATASYEIYRRPAQDVNPQTVVTYATVPASARHADGTFEFVDQHPSTDPGHPCFSIGAKVGDEAPQSSTASLCLPTLPGPAMAGLQFSANPGPDVNSWYVTGAHFAPGSDVWFQESACGTPATPVGHAQATFDGYAVGLLRLGSATTPRTIVACQPGWLPEQEAQAPAIQLPATQPGVGLGYPLTTTTGIAEVDRVLQAIRTGPESMIALLHPHDAVTQFGEHVIGVPAWQCGQFVSRDSLNQQASEAMPPSSLLYAVYRIDSKAAPWQLFDGADYAIVLANPGIQSPVGSVVAVSADGIVGFGWSCGSLPPSFVRANAGFVLAPPTTPQAPPPTPGPPAAGSGVATSHVQGPMLGGAVLAASVVCIGAGWVATRRQRHGTRSQR